MAVVVERSVWQNRAIEFTLLCLRLVVGLLFVHHGAMKMLGLFGGGPPPAMWTQMWFAGALELYGGMLVMLGLFTRVVAFILSGEMAVAYFQAHQPHGTWPIQNHGEPAVLFCFIFLFLAAMGGGNWSVDWLLWGRKKKATAAP